MSSENKLVIVKKHFASNTTLCRAGEICQDIFLLIQGTVQVTLDDEIMQVIDRKGSFVGELAPLLNQPSSTTISTATDCECIVIPNRYLRDLIVQDPKEDISLLGVLAERLLRNASFLPDIELELDGTVLGEASEKAAPPTLDRKLILIEAQDKYRDHLEYHFRPLGFEVVPRNDPGEVINQLNDLGADLIVYNCVDFPRHWKPMLKLLRETKNIEEVIFILITDSSFDFDEAAKAAYLKINGIIPENLLDKGVMFQLNDVIRRYKSLVDKRKFNRMVPKSYEQFRLLFTHPTHNFLVTGVISDVSLEGANFIPKDSSLIADLEMDCRIPSCSFRIGDDIITVDCRVTRNTREMGLEFVSFEGDGHQILFKYLMERPERGMRDFIEKHP